MNSICFYSFSHKHTHIDRCKVHNVNFITPSRPVLDINFKWVFLTVRVYIESVFFVNERKNEYGSSVVALLSWCVVLLLLCAFHHRFFFINLYIIQPVTLTTFLLVYLFFLIHLLHWSGQGLFHSHSFSLCKREQITQIENIVSQSKCFYTV